MTTRHDPTLPGDDAASGPPTHGPASSPSPHGPASEPVPYGPSAPVPYGPSEPDRHDRPAAVGAADPAEAAEAPTSEDGSLRGVWALTAEQFSIADAIGGPRGLVESLAPGLLFVVVYVATSDLRWSLIASVAVAAVALVARLVQRTPVTQAFGGMIGVAIGVVWAWRSGDGRDYFAWGLWTNAAYLAAILVSIVVRWPLVGVVVEALRSGWGERPDTSAATTARQETASPETADPETANTQAEASTAGPAAPAGWASWRADRDLLRRYTWATWLWVGLFGLRLAVQVPLYTHSEVGWLGTARLVMGIPLWALVLWLTWVLVRRPHREVSPPGR